jgi:hypothetical protein
MTTGILATVISACRLVVRSPLSERHSLRVCHLTFSFKDSYRLAFVYSLRWKTMTSSVERRAIARADSGISDRGCRLYQNGVGPYPDHADTCPECRLRLYLIARAREHGEYKIRGSDGRVLSANWLL